MAKKQLAYYYDSVIRPAETVVDLDDEFDVPKQGQVLRRPDGKDWKVEVIQIFQEGSGALPVYRIYLVPA